VFEEVFGVQGRVEAVEANGRGRVEVPDALGDADAEAQGRVHGDRDGDQPCLRDLRLVEVLHGDVQRVRREAGPFQERQGQGRPERLMPEFVTGDDQDGTRGPQVHGSALRWARGAV